MFVFGSTVRNLLISVTFSLMITLPIVTAQDTKSLGEDLENLGRLYKGDSSELFQEFWLLGRYQGQYHWSEGSGEDMDDEGYETRRLRMGGQAKLFNKLTLHAQMLSGSDVSPFYNGFTELWAQWAFSQEFMFTLGQQKHRFTHDRNVSSRYLNYLERGMLTNMFGADYTPAATLQGTINKFSYYTGVFSNATGRNMGDAFTELDSGFSYLGAVYYDLEHTLDTETANVYFSYLYSDAKENATNLNRFNNGVSSALILTEGSMSLVTEATLGLNETEGSALGINLQPGYFLTDNLQMVGRCQIASSDKQEGLRAQRRYEMDSSLSNGDLYSATYMGLNYYIAEHRLKLMTGIEYSTLGGEQVWTSSAMFRFFFGPHSGGAFPMNRMLPGSFFEHD
jgi:phosphate-selective porin OprO/OprP